MENDKEIAIPMAINVKLDHDLEGKLIDVEYYRSVIDNLPNLIANRPNILFEIGMCV